MESESYWTLKNEDFDPPGFSYVIGAREWALYRDGVWGKWNEEAVMRRTERETEMRRERIGSVLIVDDPHYFGLAGRRVDEKEG